MTRTHRRAAAVLSALLLLAGTACDRTTRGRATPTGGAAPGGPVTEAAAQNPLAAPARSGAGSVAGGTPAAATPTKTPAQAGSDLSGRAVPTNQWWTSALTGPGTQPIWAHPLAVQAGAGGLAVSSATPTASANAIVTPFTPAFTTAGAVTGVHVSGYGAFHVVLRADLAGGGTVEATVVQGSPVLYLRFSGTAPVLVSTGPGQVSGSGAALRVQVAGQPWDLRATGGATWRQDGTRFTVSGGDGRVALARVPSNVDERAWDRAIAGAASDPVVDTTSSMTYDAAGGTVTQTLSARRASGGPGVWALLPHQSAGLVPDPAVHHLAGGYQEALGTLSLVDGADVRVRVPVPGLLTGAPSLPVAGGERAALLADVNQDLADPPGAGGSYFGLKELGRLAGIAEVAGAIGAQAQRSAALSRLRTQLVDWLTYSGPGDGRYLAYDPRWGGLLAVPSEFGASDYNDPHLQYGYLVRAAAVLGQADPGFVRDYGSIVDDVVRDYAGALAFGASDESGGGAGGFPPFRVFNAYLGHSAASGFAPFADGNNQESSSEAVAAWEGVVRWGLVRGNATLTTYGLTHYAMEAATANRYWLGSGMHWATGYAHATAGIVWDAKVDYATFFDAKPESVQGIQLFPVTLGSLYRADPAAAKVRRAALAREVGGPPRVWGDVFAADLAIVDPTAARQGLTPGLPREPSTSRAIVRYWIDLLAAFGPPLPGTSAGGPYGMVFTGAGHPVLVATNPTDRSRTVTFYRNGASLGSLGVGAGATGVRR